MDLIDECRELIKAGLKELESQENCREPDASTQTIIERYRPAEQDKNLNKILNQQTHLKRIIDQDNNIQLLKNALARVTLEIDGLRKACTKHNEEALKKKQELLQSQAKELERYQMNAIRTISEAYERHQQILDTRKSEIVALQKHIEKEVRERSSYLADIERKLEAQLRERQQAFRGGSLPFPQTATAGVNDFGSAHNDPDHLELTSVDEYAPYGAASHSRLPAAPPRGGRGGRGRGRRRGRA